MIKRLLRTSNPLQFLLLLLLLIIIIIIIIIINDNDNNNGNFKEHMKRIGVNVRLEVIQKTALLGTAKILRKVVFLRQVVFL